MMALACDEIIMGAHSQLGPIDPQLTIGTPEGPRSAPAQAILDQFEKAKEECQDPRNIAAWLPILRSYAPGLLAVCDNGRHLAEEFATRSLENHMFASHADAHQKAEDAARWFANFTAFRSHGRRVGLDDARGQNIKVIDLEAEGDLQDAILSVHHAFNHTFGGTPAFKIIENHHGRAYVKQRRTTEIVMQGQIPFGPMVPGLQPGPVQPGLPGPAKPRPPPRKQQKRGGRRR